MKYEELKSEIESLKSDISVLQASLADISKTLFNLLATNGDDSAFRARVVAAVKDAQRLWVL